MVMSWWGMTEWATIKAIRSPSPQQRQVNKSVYRCTSFKWGWGRRARRINVNAKKEREHDDCADERPSRRPSSWSCLVTETDYCRILPVFCWLLSGYIQDFWFFFFFTSFWLKFLAHKTRGSVSVVLRLEDDAMLSRSKKERGTKFSWENMREHEREVKSRTFVVQALSSKDVFFLSFSYYFSH